MTERQPRTSALRKTSEALPRRRRRLPALLGALALSLLGPTAAAQAATETAEQANPATPLADAQIVDSTGVGGNTVAFTFDDGPNPSDTPRLLQILRQYQVKAVFCLWGEHVQQNPQLVQQIVADGHVLCNHTMSHEDMGNWSPDQIRANLEATNAVIQQAAPGARIVYFRAPNGNWGQSPQVAAELGLQPLGWRLAINDWEPPGTDELVRRLRQGVTPGAVVLLHDGGGDRSQTVSAVEQVIPEFQASGWAFTLPDKSGQN